MPNQLTWTRCQWFAADEAAGADGLTYYVNHSYPTTDCPGAYFPEVRRSLVGKPTARLGMFPWTPQGLEQARAACEADHAERLAKIEPGVRGEAATSELIDAASNFFAKTA